MARENQIIEHFIICIPCQILLGHDNVTDGGCTMYDRNKQCIQNLAQKCDVRWPRTKPWNRWDNIKTDCNFLMPNIRYTHHNVMLKMLNVWYKWWTFNGLTVYLSFKFPSPAHHTRSLIPVLRKGDVLLYVPRLHFYTTAMIREILECN